MPLSGCNLSKMFKALEELSYKSLDEFFKKNNYTETKVNSEFNPIMQDHIYFWSERVQTFTNTSNTDIVHCSPRSDTINYIGGYNQVTIRSRYSENFTVWTRNNTDILRYENEDGVKVYVYKDLSRKYVDDEGYLVEMDDEHSSLIKVHEYNDGYLFKTCKNFMFYVDKALDNYYFNIDGTKTFTNYGVSITLPDSDLLSEGMNAFGNYEKFTLPLPANYSNGIYHKDYLDEDDGHWIAYDVILPYADILQYVQTVKDAGLEIYRGENHPLFDFDGAEKGGEWVFYDKNHEFVVHLEYEYPIATVLKGKDSSNYGVRMRVQRAEEKFSYFGSTVNTQTDWKETDKQTMMNSYGIVLPFVNLGRRYHVEGTLRANGEHPLTSPLDMDVKCYWIFDNFYKDVITETYGEKLVQAGFVEYVPPADIQAWKDSEDVKYAECYINDELDLAIKFMFDDIYGNTIKIFKKSEMLSWHNMAKDD